LLMGGRAAEERSKSCSRWMDRFGRWKSPAFEISRSQVSLLLSLARYPRDRVVSIRRVRFFSPFLVHHDFNLKTTAATCDAYKCGVLSFKKRRRYAIFKKYNRITQLAFHTNLNL
jgi:hypothetical protein